MIVSLIGDYRLSIVSSTHWLLLLIAAIGLVTSCVLIYRRFTRELPRESRQVSNLSLNKIVHLFFLLVGNIAAFVSVLLFVLPFEAKIQALSFDLLLTPGLHLEKDSGEFNIPNMDNEQIQQQFESAEQIWLLVEENTADNSDALNQWLVQHYQDKVMVIRSIQELTTFWLQKDRQQSKYFADSKVPPLVKVFGDGLTSAQWQHLSAFNHSNKGDVALGKNSTDKTNEIAFEFTAAKRKLGLIDLTWPKQLSLGQALTVTGQLQQPADDNRQFQLSLVNNATELDSMIIQGNERFSLTAASKFSGIFNYQLLLREIPASATKQSHIQAISEDIAFSVDDGSRLRVLIKQSSPSFETRRIKQWLSQANSRVQLISKISENNWAQQKVNSNEKDVTSTEPLASSSKVAEAAMVSHLLSESLLIDNDILIIDSRMLYALADMEIDAIYKAVLNGLGLLIIADSSLIQDRNLLTERYQKLLKYFELTAGDNPNEQVVVQWPEKANIGGSEEITALSSSINIKPKLGQSIIESTTGKALVVKQSLGLGAIAISTLSETYQWALQMSPAFYSQYWQYLLSTISRGDTSTRWLVPMSARFNKINQQQNICLVSSNAQVYANEVKLSQYPLSQYQKCGLFLAQQKGWYQFTALSEAPRILAEQMRYFYDEAGFLAWQQAEKIRASIRNVENLRPKQHASHAKDYDQVNKFYLWCFLFLSLAILWIERKWQTG